MHLDDVPTGKVLTRREALAQRHTDPTGVSSSCVVRPELTEGPYYVDEELNRSDIRAGAFDVALNSGS
jgi:hypothetical protein